MTIIVMKKILLILLLVVFSLRINAQSRHEFEVLSGRAVTLNFLVTDYELSNYEPEAYVLGRSVIGAAYRLDIYKGLKVGVKYMYSPNYTFGGDFKNKTQNHIAVVTGEYRFQRVTDFSTFICFGSGTQYIHEHMFNPEKSINKVSVRRALNFETGFVVKSTWRVSSGYYNNEQEPFMYLTLGYLL